MNKKYYFEDRSKSIKERIIPANPTFFKKTGLDGVMKEVTGKRTEKLIALVKQEEDGVEMYSMEIIEFFNGNSFTDNLLKNYAGKTGFFVSMVMLGTPDRRYTIVNLNPTTEQESILQKVFSSNGDDVNKVASSDVSCTKWTYTYRRQRFQGALGTSCYRIG